MSFVRTSDGGIDDYLKLNLEEWWRVDDRDLHLFLLSPNLYNIIEVPRESVV